MEFNKIDLKPMSWNILETIVNQEPQKACDIAAQLNLSTRQVDAAITRSLIRYGFVKREAHLTRVKKKEYNLITITQLGQQYVAWVKGMKDK